MGVGGAGVGVGGSEEWGGVVVGKKQQLTCIYFYSPLFSGCHSPFKHFSQAHQRV